MITSNSLVQAHSSVKAALDLARNVKDPSNLSFLSKFLEEYVNHPFTFEFESNSVWFIIGAQLDVMVSAISTIAEYARDNLIFHEFFGSTDVQFSISLKSSEDSRGFSIKITMNNFSKYLETHSRTIAELLFVIMEDLLKAMVDAPVTLPEAVRYVYSDGENSSTIVDSVAIPIIQDKFIKLISGKLSDFEVAISNPKMLRMGAYFNGTIMDIADYSEMGLFIAQMESNL